jgi:AcrR family transcriptional regulator
VARTRRQEATVDALVAAALDHLREHGEADLSVRAVAARAGVTHTTAYTYFRSREHLVAEVFWRRLRDQPAPTCSPEASFADRAVAALAEPALVAEDERALARAGLTALLAADDEVARLRARIGGLLARRIELALVDAAPHIVDALLLAYNGAMLQAGTGDASFGDVSTRLRGVADLLDPARSGPARSPVAARPPSP